MVVLVVIEGKTPEWCFSLPCGDDAAALAAAATAAAAAASPWRAGASRVLRRAGGRRGNLVHPHTHTSTEGRQG